MDNDAEGREKMLPDNDMSNQNTHLSDGEFLLIADGELPPEETVRVRCHLEACWTCRARNEQIAATIIEVVEYRKWLSRPHLSSLARGRAMFIAQFEQFTRDFGPPPLANRVAGKLRAWLTFSQTVLLRHVWINAVAISALALVFFAALWNRPQPSKAPKISTVKISASEFLAQAQASEALGLAGVVKPVIYEQLRIRIGSQNVIRTIYRDTIGKRRAEHVNFSKSEGGNGSAPTRASSRSPADRIETELQQVYKMAHLNWDEPLSPASFSTWHNNLRQKVDEVSEPGDNFLTLRTTTVEGPVAEGSITVRTTDFRPVSESYLLQDSRVVEVSELAWFVFPLDTLNPTLFAFDAATVPVLADPRPRIAASDMGSDLAEAELLARIALHSVGADLGEQIEFQHGTSNLAAHGRRSLIVRGILSTPERKAELTVALQGLPLLELRLQTVEETRLQEKQTKQLNLQGVDPPQSQASDLTPAISVTESSVSEPQEGSTLVPPDGVAGGVLLEQQLQEFFPLAEKRAAFVNRAVAVTQEALVQAWALRRLRDRYTPNEVVQLSYGSRQTLGLLIRDHVSVLRRMVDEAGDLISPVLPQEPASAVSPLVDHGTPLPVIEPSDDWRWAVSEIFPAVQNMRNSVFALFAQPGLAASERQVRVLDLRLALMKLESQLARNGSRLDSAISLLGIAKQ